MKKIILCLTAILLLFATCDKGCKIKRPKNLKPIDWENYNDVNTVYWNCVKSCEKYSDEHEGKIVKISGWIDWYKEYNIFTLCDDSKNLGYGSTFPSVIIKIKIPGIGGVVLSNKDFTKKIYIEGRLSFGYNFFSKAEGFYNSPKADVIITIETLNDFYFEYEIGGINNE